MYEIMTMPTSATALNNKTYTDYYYRLMLLAKSLFKWKNLPKGIDEKHIEQFLFSHGYCMFYKDKTLGYIVARCNKLGFNYYDEPTKLRPFGNNLPDTNEKLIGDECILIRNNDECLPTYPTIRLYAYRLTEIQRAIDTNVSHMKIPYIIKCGEKVKLSLKQVMKQKDNNEPIIFADKSIEELANIDALKTDAPIVFDKLQIQKHAVWNECMTFLGINNANMDKRERLVDDEVQANNEQIELAAQTMLKAREKACELINAKYGLKISVELRKPKNEDLKVLEGGEDSVQNNNTKNTN